MAIYSPQRWFCNACGSSDESPLPNVMGRKWRVCSRECLREMNWRETLSIMNKPYHPQPDVDTPNEAKEDKSGE